MTGIRVLPAGTAALLVEMNTLEEVLALQKQLLQRPLPGQAELVTAAKTLLIRTRSEQQLAELTAALQNIQRLDTSMLTPGKVVDIDVVYDGADLSTICAQLQLSESAFIQQHSGQNWQAAFGGFAPGFAYLVTDGNWPSVPRRETPRTRIPPGSVALADHFSGIYPRASPGGWQLIGHTDSTPIFQLDHEPPALIQPGDTVRFRAVRQIILARDPEQKPEVNLEAKESAADLTVFHPGLQTLIQDDGRPGLADQGITASGFADRNSAHAANTLVGNPVTTPLLETLGGLEILAHQDQVCAVTGADGEIRVASAAHDFSHPATTERPANTPFALRAGEKLMLGIPHTGLRRYLAFRGGLEVPLVLRSAAEDTLSDIASLRIRANTHLRMHELSTGGIVAAPNLAVTMTPNSSEIPVTLRVILGPRQEWFSTAALKAFFEQSWEVSRESNRVGIRLLGDPIPPEQHKELPSEGMVTGALQVPPSGLPVLFLPDHPVTGGYPVIAVVVDADLDTAAQLSPGTKIRFQAATRNIQEKP